MKAKYFSGIQKSVYKDPPTGRIYRDMKLFYQNSNITFLSPLLGSQIRNHLLKNERIRATSGLIGLVMAISLCPNPPDIAGFSLGNSDLYPYHYYSAFKKSYLTKVHNASSETAVIKRMFGCRLLGNDLTNGILNIL